MSGYSTSTEDELLVSPRPSTIANPDLVKATLDRILYSKKDFLRSARASYFQFNGDESGGLNLEEASHLIAKLCDNLKVPPVDNKTMRSIFLRFDEDADGLLDLSEFCQMYWRLLMRIKERYYPEKHIQVERQAFVGRISLAKEARITDVLTFVKKIGSGSFGEVHLVTEAGNALTRVCKVIKKEQAAVPMDQIEAEIEVLKNLDHPNIIKVFDIYEDSTAVYITMELCEGGELMSRISQAQERNKTLSERYVMILMKQIMQALTYFHTRNVLHKDLKPENVLFQDESPTSPLKVIDFGLAEIFHRRGEYSHNAAGTVLYMAPEVFQRRLHLKCDVWSAGCIMYLMLTGHLPFTGDSALVIKHKVLHEEPDYQRQCRHISPHGIDLLKWMLQKSPHDRCTAAESLQHSWFTGGGSGLGSSFGGGTATILPKEICDNLKAYTRQSNLKNVLLNLMAHQLDFTTAQVRLVSRVFASLDSDGNGLISSEEMARGLRDTDCKPWEISKIVQALDIDDSGAISYTSTLR